MRPIVIIRNKRIDLARQWAEAVASRMEFSIEEGDLDTIEELVESHDVAIVVIGIDAKPDRREIQHCLDLTRSLRVPYVFVKNDNARFGTIGVPVKRFEEEKEKAPYCGSFARNFGSHVEVFYNYPDMFDKYYHLMVNVKGLVMSAIQLSGTQRDNSFRTNAKIATKVLGDRWIAEIAIPTSEIGMKCFDGATWKLNVGRSRKLEGMAAAKAETSSCCNGAFHGAANFVNVKFAPSRAKGLHQSAQVSAWENSGFEASVSNAKINRHYRWNAFTFPADGDLVPKGWYGKFLNGEYVAEDGNRFVRIRPGKDSYLSQYFVSDAPGKVRISFRFRGRGKVALWTALYTDTPTKHGYRLQDGTSKNEIFTATGDWQCVTVDRAKNGKPTERMAVRFAALKDSEIDIDDVVVSPIGE